MSINHCRGCLRAIPATCKYCEDCAGDAMTPLMPDLAQRIAGRILFLIVVVLVVTWLWRIT